MNEKNKLSWYWLGGIFFLIGLTLFIYFGLQNNSAGINKHKEATSIPAAQAPPSDEYPQFPWPPPSPTASYKIDAQLLSILENKNITLGEIDEKIANALVMAGYTQKAYFAVADNGFALVTQLEQINQNGTPKEGKERFTDKVPPRKIDSWEAYIKALFTPSARGYFRIIVFIVTDKPFSTSGGTPEYPSSVFWLDEGMNVIPPEVAPIKFTQYSYTITALVYEFEKPQNGEALPVERKQGAMTGIEYIRNLFLSIKE
jgi:hypothetical protein